MVSDREMVSDPRDLGMLKDKHGMQVELAVVQSRHLLATQLFISRCSCICANLPTD